MTQKERLTQIADAIRKKKNITRKIPAYSFAAEILTIETGGSVPAPPQKDQVIFTRGIESDSHAKCEYVNGNVCDGMFSGTVAASGNISTKTAGMLATPARLSTTVSGLNCDAKIGVMAVTLLTRGFSSSFEAKVNIGVETKILRRLATLSSSLSNYGELRLSELKFIE